MLEFAHPWLFALLPLPLLLWWLLPPYREPREAVQTPFFQQLAALMGFEPQEGAVVRSKTKAQRLLGALVWILLVGALAGPQWVEPPIVKQVSARDMMLAVDLSGSMETEDFTDEQGAQVSRLDAVKLVLDDFIARREADRLGLIVFGNAPYIQAPFSQDHDTVRYLLEQTRVGMAGPQTMMGDAIGFAITRFEESASSNRVLILLTDGNDTGSKMPPQKAADIAADHGITIHTVAMGDPKAAGEQALDIPALEGISKATRGRFFQAGDREELEGIYRALDELEPGVFETLSYRPRRALFHWPLGVAVLLLLTHHVVSALVTRRGEEVAHA